MKYAHIDNNNKLLGWYDKDIHSEIPEPNIEVSEEQWQEALNKSANKINEDGSSELFDFRTEEEIINQELEYNIAEAKQYLLDTDWYIIRYTDTGKEVPVEVKTKREEARNTIGELNGN